MVLLPDPILSDLPPDAVLGVGMFSSTPDGVALPDGWEPLIFKKIPRHTRYTLVMEAGQKVVKANSEASSSGLIRKIRIDPRAYPLIEWRWKVLNIYQKGDVTTKAGDDYPARLYITFESDPASMDLFEKLKYETARLLYGEYPPGGAITYIWESKTPKGSVVPNPYTDRVKMIVVESGDSLLHQWIQEERNVYEDYKSAFGQEPPMISGVAIMSDSDNTGESTTAYYGDIIFKKSVK
ncbi:MAG: DUF3047 domain-containing protein [Desulfobacterales bacterium]|nr:DUF3047 domain-containing protein [Desulfobacterales bacterium]